MSVQTHWPREYVCADSLASGVCLCRLIGLGSMSVQTHWPREYVHADSLASGVCPCRLIGLGSMSVQTHWPREYVRVNLWGIHSNWAWLPFTPQIWGEELGQLECTIIININLTSVRNHLYLTGLWVPQTVHSFYYSQTSYLPDRQVIAKAILIFDKTPWSQNSINIK